MKKTLTICSLLVAFNFLPGSVHAQLLASSAKIPQTQKDTSAKSLKSALTELESKFKVRG